MAGRARDYVKQVHGQTGYWLNYPPAAPLKLGDIVIRERGVWIAIGNTADRGVVIEEEVDDSKAGTPWVSASDSGWKIETTINADPGVFKYVQPGEVGAKVTLDKGNKYVLSLKGARFPRVKSIDKYWNDVRSEYSFWTWDLRRRVVTSICTAESGTFLGSGSSEAAYELQAEAGFKLQGGLDLGTLSADFKLVSTYSSSETFAALADVSPLFRLHKVTIFGDFDAAAVDADPASPPTDATRLEDDDTDPDDDGD